MSAEQVLIPDIGEATDVEVVEVCVNEGDSVAKDACLIVLESEKASMEVPSPFDGVVRKLGVALGDKVEEGQLIVEIEARGEDAERPRVEGEQSAPSAPPKPAPQRKDETPREAASSMQTHEYEVSVPEVGEAKDIKVVEVLVSPGDRVDAEDPLVVLESDKATMELPPARAGRVKRVAVAEGEEVFEGTLIAVLEIEDDVAPPSPAVSADDAQRNRAASEFLPAAAPPAKAAAQAPAPEATTQEETYAGPAVRRLARELGVELGSVRGTGAKGRILKEDLDAYVKERLGAEAGGSAIPPLPQVDFERYGPIETVPVSRIRRAGAANLHRSWLNIPHVTQHDEADVTELESFRKEHREEGRERGVNLTPLPFIMKACCKALVDFPRFNASLSSDGTSFVIKKYYHFGVAVDTEDGLVVPVIRDVDSKDIWQLAGEIQDVASRARAGKLGLDAFAGGSFSVSSLGILGGTGFTPIINAPEVAILGIAKLATRPSWNGEAFVPRQMLPLSLSYDHRANNGAEAARFLTLIARLLADIRLLLL